MLSFTLPTGSKSRLGTSTATPAARNWTPLTTLASSAGRQRLKRMVPAA